jgi:hypothetical protein
MMRAAMVALVLMAGPVSAEEWRLIDGPGIRAALKARVLVYADGTLQDFFADGRTLYGDQWGRWAVRDDRYCSSWPPAGRWDCYEVALRGLEVRFTSGGKDAVVGKYVDLQ